MAKSRHLGIEFDFTADRRDLTFVNSRNFRKNEIARTLTNRGTPTYLGRDHNEDVLMVDDFRSRGRIRTPLAKVLVDGHSDIDNHYYRMDECHIGSWVRNAFELGQADPDLGLCWLYRRRGSVPVDFMGKSFFIPNYHKSGIPVTAICIDDYDDNLRADQLLLSFAQKALEQRSVLAASVDWDAGMKARPMIGAADNDFAYFEDDANMADHLRRSTELGAYDIDLVRATPVNTILRAAGLITAFRSPEFCLPAYAVYEERKLLAKF